LDRQVTRLVGAAGVGLALTSAAILLSADPARGRHASFVVWSGAAFGLALQRSRLCFASAFRDVFLTRDRRAALGLLTALALGSLGYTVVLQAWIPDPGAGYLPPTAHIAPASWHLLLGGASFGFGMVLAGGCLSGQLYRLGEGSVPAWAALAGALVGFVGGYGAWNRLYTATIATAPVVWLPKQLGYGGALAAQLAVIGALAALLLLRLPPPRAREAAPVTLGVALRRVFVDAWPSAVGGAVVAVVGTFALLRTRPLGVTAELGRVSRQLGNALGVLPERLEGLDRMAGCRALEEGGLIGENGLFVLALVGGSAFGALLAGEFRLRIGKPGAWARAFGGGALMGAGAMISLGCTVGTLLSGIMALSLSGWVFALGLFGGATAGGRAMRALA
jgi:uncharacterized membrane protein YedE/YeeE